MKIFSLNFIFRIQKMLNGQKRTRYFHSYLGYQVMANNVLYKTKSSDGLESGTQGVNDARKGPANTIYERNGIRLNNKELSLVDQEKFAADFQRQHHQHRWGQGIKLFSLNSSG